MKMTNLTIGDDFSDASPLSELMEYREAPSSPGASSVHSLNMDNMDPTTPDSPPPIPPQDMDDERLPNELLDEICEDIGMKEGMELDFVEFLMEQDMVDPQVYMTPEAIRNTLASTACTSVSQSGVLSTPKTEVVNNRTCGSPNTTYSQASTTNCTVATSSGSSSPAAKRFHASTSGPTSPVRVNAPLMPSEMFKAPQTPPTPRRPSSQSIASPSISSTQGPQHSPLPPRSVSPQTTQNSVPSSPSQKQPPSYSQSMSQNSMYTQSVPERMSQKGGIPPGLQRQGVVPHNYQRLGRPAPPNVNVQNMQSPHTTFQQQKWNMCDSSAGQMNNPACSMGNMGRPGFPPQTQQYGRTLESPLDQGYFSGDTASVRSYGSSSVSSTVPSSVPPSATGDMQNSMHLRQGPPNQGSGLGQKSVHFADLPGDQNVPPLQRQRSNDSMGYGQGFDPSVSSDCDVENEFRDPNHRGAMNSNKIMPRLTPSMKSEIAPYTVPNVNGQVAMSPYRYDGRSNSRPSSGDNPMAPMQQFDFPPQHKTGDMCGVDNNQNSMHLNNFNNSVNNNMSNSLSNNMSNSLSNNMNNSMQQPTGETDYRVSCSGGAPIGMQPLSHFDGSQGQYGMQQQANLQGRGQMYPNSIQETDHYKLTANMTNPNMENYCDNGFRNSQGQNMNSSCGMMNRGTPKMMGGPQVSSNQGTPLGMMGGPQVSANQGTPQGMMRGPQVSSNQGTPQGMIGQQQGQSGFRQNFMSGVPCGNSAPRPLHMNAMTSSAQMMPPNQGGIPPEYSRLQGVPETMNNSPMYQNSQPQFSQANMGPGTGNNPAWAGATPQTPQPHMGVHPKVPQQQQQQHPGMGSIPIPGTPGGQNPMQGGAMPQCTTPNCQSCKTGSPHRPPMLASQQTFIQHLITDRSNAFRSHPLFPLLRDLIIADMNFNSPSFPYQLISNLPAEFDKLLQNFLHRNPPSGNYQTNFSVESVVMDALKYAHTCLIEKIRSRQEQDKHTKSTSKSLSAIEEFCEKFDRSVRNTIIKPATFQVPNHTTGVTSTSMAGQPMDGGMTPTMGTPQKSLNEMMIHADMFSSPAAKKGLDLVGMASPQFKSLRDLSECNDNGSMVSSSSQHSIKSESKKHPSLPKEAVAIMLDWLRQHKDNPYPNDDEKAMLIKQTGLTINQINYWFTNARRRILPKWAQQCK
ncbi:uncharacterized protein LOC110456217 isoform X2 [Mizuhopecten yessoensis]|uniref:uncharacterized protein LOC110456217 isoform X2 n=1 Tax=Mizuhopecten yessoensis TaxID=6573 RepID=UPI000B45DF8D|nr:uncharacterized protein LOC110456217 isoform X2 [Mizuhopecten yessoensis]